MSRAIRWTIIALVVALGLSGCSRKDEPGVVARVNGRAIRLELLEFAYDMRRAEGLSTAMPSVGALRKAYGGVLGTLIAQELIAQELEKRGQGVTAAELSRAEARVRADYPGDTFDRMLADEFIDLKMWREQLRYACGIEKFRRLVLRPMIHVDYREAEAYYRAHVAAFHLPERVRLLVVRAPERALVAGALASYEKEGKLRDLARSAPRVLAREITVPQAMLTPAWAEALRGSATGQGVILSGGAGFEGLLLLARLPAKTLSAAQAYPRVEAALVEGKLQRAFDSWIAGAAAKSEILVSRRLLHKAEGEDVSPGPAESAGGNATQPNVASGNETG